jgi:uncharacterized protein
MKRKQKTWIECYSGHRFNLAHPRGKDVCIEDIARGLALTVRFGGQLDDFYCVAQHSVRVQKRLAAASEPPSVQLYGLLHDAAEAYAGDVVKPLKSMLSGYQRLEPKIMRAILRGLGLQRLLRLTRKELEAVKKADQEALMAERRDLKTRAKHCRNYHAHNQIIKGVKAAPPEDCMTWKEAEVLFTLRFYQLFAQVTECEIHVVPA